MEPALLGRVRLPLPWPRAASQTSAADMGEGGLTAISAAWPEDTARNQSFGFGSDIKIKKQRVVIQWHAPGVPGQLWADGGGQPGLFHPHLRPWALQVDFFEIK